MESKRDKKLRGLRNAIKDAKYYIAKLENINIINDLSFLTAVADSLKKIVNLSNVFAKFKETIIATSTIKIPKSAHDTKVILENVMDEVSCAMNYINHFVNPEYNVEHGELSDSDKEKCDINDLYNYYKFKLLTDDDLMIADSNAYLNVADDNADIIPINAQNVPHAVRFPVPSWMTKSSRNAMIAMNQ